MDFGTRVEESQKHYSAYLAALPNEEVEECPKLTKLSGRGWCGTRSILPWCHSILSSGTKAQIDPEATRLRNAQINRKQNKKLSTKLLLSSSPASSRGRQSYSSFLFL